VATLQMSGDELWFLSCGACAVIFGTIHAGARTYHVHAICSKGLCVFGVIRDIR